MDRMSVAIERDALHHAYLFEGPSGLGKGLVARWVAMAANCERASNTACGECPSCLQISGDSHPDVVWLRPENEGASAAIKVDQVREVIRQVGYHRFSARHRFVIIDPVETMAAAAANALLKTLEEPPAGTHFVLVTNRARALLPTIVSRCQHVRFAACEIDVVRDWLEERGVQDAASIARLSMGCPGRALQLVGGEHEQRRKLRQEPRQRDGQQELERRPRGACGTSCGCVSLEQGELQRKSTGLGRPS